MTTEKQESTETEKAKPGEKTPEQQPVDIQKATDIQSEADATPAKADEKTTNHTPAHPAQADTPAPKASQAAGAGSFSDIGNAFTTDWPQAAPHFIDQVKADATDRSNNEQPGPAKKTPAAKPVDFRLLTDANGHYFDPKICVSKLDPETGQPAKTPSGLWRLKRDKDRKQLKTTVKKTAAAAANPKIEKQGIEEQQALLAKQIETTAKVMDMVAWFTIETVTGEGADATAQNQGKQSLVVWLQSLESPPVPPAWLMPIFIYGNALRSRMIKPAAAPRRKAWREKFAGVVGYFRGRKARKAAATQPQKDQEES